MRRLVTLLRPVRRAVLARRRPLAALLTAVAVATGLHAATASPPARVPVLVAARDLPSGVVLTGADLRSVGFSPASVPDGAVADPTGRTLAGPLRAGEPVTDVRLVGPSLTDGYPGLSAVPVRLPDAAMVGLLAVGDRIDLVSTDPQGSGASVVAADVPVLALPTGDATTGGQVGAGVGAAGLGGRLVVVGVEPGEVEPVADASVRTFLTVAFSG